MFKENKIDRIINPINNIKQDTRICVRASGRWLISKVRCTDREWATAMSSLELGIRICLKKIK